MPIQFTQGIETWSFTLVQNGPSGVSGNFIHSNSLDRTYIFPDKDGTVALLSDLSENSNSGGQQTVDTVILSQAMPALTCFRIGPDGRAFIVTANDGIIPIVEGITLESGGIGSTVNVARIKNELYNTPYSYSSFQLYYLTSTGNISPIRPINTLYQVMVGHSVPDSASFIFDPQLPIRLS
jgi:hypothetical protein